MTKPSNVVENAAIQTPVKKASAKPLLKEKSSRVISSASLTVKVFDLEGKAIGTLPLPKEIFGQAIKQKLLTQAIRVYQQNEIPSTAHTKTRGEVRGGGIKPWRQKGTGRARAGSIRSPLWKGGGTTFGPRYRATKLNLPQKMKHKALIYALSDKAKQGKIKIISNLEKTLPKTKVIASLLTKLEIPKRSLMVISQKNQNVKLASRNIPSLSLDIVDNLNAYQILQNKQIIISKEALSKFS